MNDKSISHFTILEKPGEGGMGIVYKAHDTKPDRLVTLKFLPRYLTTDRVEKDRFYREDKAASALTHPHVTLIHEIDETSDARLIIAMELVEGETLKQSIGAGTVAFKVALDIAIHVSESLRAAPEKGIVHWDIKSDNLMVGPKGEAKASSGESRSPMARKSGSKPTSWASITRGISPPGGTVPR